MTSISVYILNPAEESSGTGMPLTGWLMIIDICLLLLLDILIWCDKVKMGEIIESTIDFLMDLMGDNKATNSADDD